VDNLALHAYDAQRQRQAQMNDKRCAWCVCFDQKRDRGSQGVVQTASLQPRSSIIFASLPRLKYSVCEGKTHARSPYSSPSRRLPRILPVPSRPIRHRECMLKQR